MKHFFTITLLLGLTSLRGQTFELYSRDTINLTDVNNKKQGKWIIYGRHKVKTEQGCVFKANQKVEEGFYKDNRKTGEWKEYYCNGNTRSVINFSDGRPNGYMKLYYPDGKLKEEGTWKNNRWVGEYKKYNEEGKMEKLVYDENGKVITDK